MLGKSPPFEEEIEKLGFKIGTGSCISTVLYYKPVFVDGGNSYVESTQEVAEMVYDQAMRRHYMLSQCWENKTFGAGTGNFPN